MTNGMFFGSPNVKDRPTLWEAFVRWCAEMERHYRGQENWNPKERRDAEDVIKWVTSSASTALVFEVGQLVQIRENTLNRYDYLYGKIGTVTNIKAHPGAPNLFDEVEARFPGTCLVFKPEDLKPTEIPEAILELAKAQLQANCPLKKATCHE